IMPPACCVFSPTQQSVRASVLQEIGQQEQQRRPQPGDTPRYSSSEGDRSLAAPLAARPRVEIISGKALLRLQRSKSSDGWSHQPASAGNRKYRQNALQPAAPDLHSHPSGSVDRFRQPLDVQVVSLARLFGDLADSSSTADV